MSLNYIYPKAAYFGVHKITSVSISETKLAQSVYTR